MMIYLFLQKGRISLLFIFFLIFSSRAFVFSQTEGTIYDVQGDFILVSSGRRTVYRFENVGDITFKKYDMIQTGAGASVELAFSDDKTRVFIGENTSFAYNGIDESGVFSLKLLYGRLRVKNTGEKAREVKVQAGDGIVSQMNGDFGFDFMAEPSRAGKPILRVYGFEGKGSLALLNGGADAPETPINEYETVSVELFSKISLVQHEKMNDKNFKLWNKNNFKDAKSFNLPIEKGGKAETAKSDNFSTPAQTPSVDSMQTQIQYIQPDYSPYYKANRIKNTAIILGSLFVASGAALEGLAGYYAVNGNNDTAKTLNAVGYGPLGLGMMVLLGAILYNPQFIPPPKQ